MQSPQTVYDIIIIYNEKIAQSAISKKYSGRLPFPAVGACANRNQSYAYFLTQCARQGLAAAFATTADIRADGSLSSVWIFKKHWRRKIELARPRYVFDKFSTAGVQDQARKNILNAFLQNVTVFHDPKIRKLFDDKLKTFDALSAYSVPTVGIDLSSKKTIRAAQRALHAQINMHPHINDFGKIYVVKDRYGSGGSHVFKACSVEELAYIGNAHPQISFILQPLINASGFLFGTHRGITDLRVIVCDGNIIQSYIRIPKAGDFRANASQGGRVVYLRIAEIPKEVLRICDQVYRILNVPHSFYALDFMKSASGHVYCVEGNSTPGLNWFDVEDEKHAKELMRVIVKNIKIELGPIRTLLNSHRI